MRDIQWCRTCLMPSSRPRVVFTDGICNACTYAEAKKSIDWSAREREFHETVEEIKDTQNREPYDCVVPFSGGKDSATVAYRLRTDFDLRPLLVCYGQLLWTEVGRGNLDRVARAGFDILYWRVDQRVSRHLARRFLIERGHPKQHYDAAVNAVPVITAQKFGIPYIFYAEHGETEYGGRILSEEHRRTRDAAEVLEHQVGDDALNWVDDVVSERGLFPYIYPRDNDCQAFYFSYFFPWDIYENAKFAATKLAFQQVHKGKPRAHLLNKTYNLSQIRLASGALQWWGKSDGSFEGYDSIDDKIDDLDYYMCYIKFGFGRSCRMASRLIQNGHLTRRQGMELVKRYDGEFPETYLTDVLNYLDLTHAELIEIIDKHRNEEIWLHEGNQWKLRHPPR